MIAEASRSRVAWRNPKQKGWPNGLFLGRLTGDAPERDNWSRNIPRLTMAENGFDSRFPVKLDGNLVMDGHHRVMTANKAGIRVVTIPWRASDTARQNALWSFDDARVDPVDWYE